MSEMSELFLCPFRDKQCVKDSCGVYDIANGECSFCSLPTIAVNLEDILSSVGDIADNLKKD
ncbi:hypothetical protein [Caproiciproducens sp. CPB-2]|uniref:hypothetical protein n=1 Tax=Caproiciproducens sp. CPB-2 TaxID=3030017 RepID=UPI0023DACD78|nr:hypothetical protein [Caproiciproducens sp. CPB-2]MDF1495187.1 hypothetical protein [Caproiciproducens sp. CPB-2]